MRFFKQVSFTHVQALMHSSSILMGAFLLVSTTLLAGCAFNGKKDPYQGMAAETIYQQAKQRLEKNRYDLAIKDFEALDARYPYGEYSDKGQLGLIYAYYKRNDHPSALAAADRFIRIHPSHPEVDYAHYIKGVVNYDDYFSFAYRYLPLDRSLRDPSSGRQAFDDFKILLEKFPKSHYVADAKKRMYYLRNHLAEHELHVAKYYFSQGAYLAAANRAGGVIHQFDGTDAVAPALILMINAYEKLGMVDLANDAKSVWNRNFPDRAFK